MTQSNDMHRAATDDCTAVTYSEIVVSVQNRDFRRGESIVTTDTPSPALIEATDIVEIFAQSQATLDLACAEGMYGSIEQCLEQAWPRVKQRWMLIETGLIAVAADTLSLEALRYKVALGDAWQRFEGQPEEREALIAMYASLVTHMAWPHGFSRYELLEAFLLE